MTLDLSSDSATQNALARRTGSRWPVAVVLAGSLLSMLGAASAEEAWPLLWSESLGSSRPTTIGPGTAGTTLAISPTSTQRVSVDGRWLGSTTTVFLTAPSGNRFVPNDVIAGLDGRVYYSGVTEPASAGDAAYRHAVLSRDPVTGDHHYNERLSGNGSIRPAPQAIVRSRPTRGVFVREFDDERVGYFNEDAIRLGLARVASSSRRVAATFDRNPASTFTAEERGGDVFLQEHRIANPTSVMTTVGSVEEERVVAMASDRLGAIYLLGETRGDLTQPDRFFTEDDRILFLARFNEELDLQWVEQLGTPGDDLGAGLLVGRDGGVFVGGSFDTNTGSPLAAVTKYSPEGELLWSSDFGFPTADGLLDLNFDAEGNLLALIADGSERHAAKLSVPAIPRYSGDFNGDGLVDGADYTIYRDSLGSEGYGLPADANGDLIVTSNDYQIWANNFGSQRQSSYAIAVPEGSSLAYGLLSIAGVIRSLSRSRALLPMAPIINSRHCS